MNKCIFVGIITSDIFTEGDVKKSEKLDGKASVRFGLTVNDYNNKAYIYCVAFGINAVNIKKYCVKGSKIGVETRVFNQKYVDKTGIERSVLNFVVDKVEFLTKNNTPAELDNSHDTRTEEQYDEADEDFNFLGEGGDY